MNPILISMTVPHMPLYTLTRSAEEREPRVRLVNYLAIFHVASRDGPIATVVPGLWNATLAGVSGGIEWLVGAPIFSNGTLALQVGMKGKIDD